MLLISYKKGFNDINYFYGCSYEVVFVMLFEISLFDKKRGKLKDLPLDLKIKIII